MKGFFSSSEMTQRTSIPLIAQCGACGLYKGCQTPKMQVQGEGRKRILLVGDFPSKLDDERGIQFTGKAGERLWSGFAKANIRRRDCWTTSAAICHPKGKLPPKAVEHCRPNIIQTIKELNPSVVVLLGSAAIQSVIGWLWKESPGNESRWNGWHIPSQQINAWVCPVLNPLHVTRIEESGKRSAAGDTFDKHLKSITEIEDKPWKEVPDFASKVEVVIDPEEAASKLGDFKRWSERFAFDYETNMLKPDSSKARIVSCAVSNGEWTLAYPWTRETAKMTGELLFSKVPKIGWNAKFEDRWTIKEFGRSVRNWEWDGMIAAHVLDCRQGITGAKFQGFVKQGQASWDGPVKHYLEAPGSNVENRIREVPLPTLLKYNGMDALMEYIIAEQQQAELKRILNQGD